MVPEAQLERVDEGLAPAGDGWFVLNARDARWYDRGERGLVCLFEGEPEFEQVGINLFVLGPGNPMSMYHWEADQEDFLVVSGEALLIAEGEERPLRQWDFVHCPPRTQHVIVGAGDRPCVLFAVGARWRHTYVDSGGVMHGREDGGAYTVSEAAIRHGAGVEKETIDANEAYARIRGSSEPEPLRYRDGWLP